MHPIKSAVENLNIFSSNEWVQPQPYEKLFYEIMWQAHKTKLPFPIPWWVQQHIKSWDNDWNRPVFGSSVAAFCSNALYRYWDMIGVKSLHQECLIGQAGELQPVYGKFTVSIFLYDYLNGKLYFPQYNEGTSRLSQKRDPLYPIIQTSFVADHCGIEQTLCTGVVTLDGKQKAIAVSQLIANKPYGRALWKVGVAILPYGPTGFQYDDRSGEHFNANSRVRALRYASESKVLLVEGVPALMFDIQPESMALYGQSDWRKEDSPLNPEEDALEYLRRSPIEVLRARGTLNEKRDVTDLDCGLCMGVFLWDMGRDMHVNQTQVELYALIDDYIEDLTEDEIEIASTISGNQIRQNTITFWQHKLAKGIQLNGNLNVENTDIVSLFKTSRVNLLTLTDGKEIHPGPTIYDGFWIRDSAVAVVSCGTIGDENVALRQVEVYIAQQQQNPLSWKGFFGGEKEKKSHEWDCNGQALWALGLIHRMYPDRASDYFPSVMDGCEWIKATCRDHSGLLPPGWSAEHLGNPGRIYYWDNLWALGGLWEAARMAERLGDHNATRRIWDTHFSLKSALAVSIRNTRDRISSSGQWQSFIPASPDDMIPQSTMVGTLAYFHPCLLAGAQIGDDIDALARYTVDTIWANFVAIVNGRAGFCHNSRDWRSYAPYLTMQLAHTLLLFVAEGNSGDSYPRFVQCLKWIVHHANPNSYLGNYTSATPVVSGAWNEQHCYPVADGERPFPWWYMGDIPHAWSCAEYMLLLRSMLFMEQWPDTRPRIDICPGIGPETLTSQQFSIAQAPTLYGELWGFSLQHDSAQHRITYALEPIRASVFFRIHCHFGSIQRATIDGNACAHLGPQQSFLDVPGNSREVVIDYI